VSWQELGVVVVVAGAVYYLWQKLLRPAKPRRSSFVPLSDLKRRK
jgi:hypothetical protein